MQMETLGDILEGVSSTPTTTGDIDRVSIDTSTESLTVDLKDEVQEDISLPSFEQFPEKYKEKSRGRIEKLETLISEVTMIEGRIEEFSSFVDSLKQNYALLQGIDNEEGQILESKTYELINTVYDQAVKLEEAYKIAEEGGDATPIVGTFDNDVDNDYWDVCMKPRNLHEKIRKLRLRKELGEEECDRRKNSFKSGQKELIRDKGGDLLSKIEILPISSISVSRNVFRKRPDFQEENYDEVVKKRVVEDFTVACQYYLQKEKVARIAEIIEGFGLDHKSYEKPSEMLKELEDTLQRDRRFLVEHKIAATVRSLFISGREIVYRGDFFQKIDRSVGICDISREEYTLLKKLTDYMTQSVERNEVQKDDLYNYEYHKGFLGGLESLAKFNSEIFPSQDNLSWHGIGISDISPILKTGKLMSRRSQMEESDEIIFSTGGGTKLIKNNDGTYFLKAGYGSGSLPQEVMSESEVLTFLGNYSSQNHKKWFDEYNQLYFSIDGPYFDFNENNIYFCFDAFNLRKNRSIGFSDGEYIFHEDYDGTLESPGMEIDLLEENYLFLINSNRYDRSIKELEKIFPETRLAEKQTFEEWVNKHVLVVESFKNAGEQVKKEFWKRFPKGERSKGYFMPTGFAEPDRPDSKLIKYKTIEE
jgi:hypothetical protein